LALEHNAGHVELRVADNGCGISHRAAGGSAPAGVGISNMRERAAALGGTLSLRSSGSRTEVIARLPVARRDATRNGSPAKVTVP
jgi:two-component system, NarL family, sensor kinase